MPHDVFGLPRVLLMGLRKSGKSSIQRVVFEGMEPHESVNLPTTVKAECSAVRRNELVNFDVWDFPGQNDPFDPNNANGYHPEQILEHCGAIVFVLDCREMIEDARARLLDTIYAAQRYDPEICIEVFIHKVDALSEDHQSDLLAILQRRVEEDAKRRLDTTSSLRLNFNLTSIYDHSVFQAFSLVVQKLIHHRTPYINELLQMLNSNSNVDLSYLFLSRSKIYLAADERNRLKAKTYDLCSDAIEVVGKMSGVYSPLITHGKTGSAPSGSDSTKGEEALHSSVISLSNEDCIYVRELPNSLTIVLMLKRSDLENKSLIDLNIDTFYKAAFSIFTA